MLPEMKRVNAIWNHPLYQKNLKESPEAGKEQDFLQAHTGAFF